ncbi:MAG: hypothetical protein V5A47_13490, partial [Bacteroidales bacterium]
LNNYTFICFSGIKLVIGEDFRYSRYIGSSISIKSAFKPKEQIFVYTIKEIGNIFKNKSNELYNLYIVHYIIFSSAINW